MSRDFDKKVLDDLRAFGLKRFGSMQNLAEAMGVRPQNLNTYLKGGRKIGPKYIARLKEIGFDLGSSQQTDCVINAQESVILDLPGALELSNTPANRLAQLVGVSPATFTAWQDGSASPSMEQLAALFNQVVALGLSARQNCAKSEVETPPAKAIG